MESVEARGDCVEIFCSGAGYVYRQKGGDNTYFVEPLGGHDFYYEAHF